MATKEETIKNLALEAASRCNSSLAKERQIGHRKRMGGFTLDMMNEVEAIMSDRLASSYDAGYRAALEDAVQRVKDQFYPHEPITAAIRSLAEKD